MHADDTALYFQQKQFIDIEKALNEDLTELSTWVKDN